jgi:hypothetical protein
VVACNELYAKVNPIDPPTVETVGEEKDRFTLPLARFTVTGPAVSVGDGPEAPMRKFTVKWLTQDGSVYWSIPSLVNTASEYAPPSWRNPVGGLHNTGPEVGALNHPEVVIAPDFPSRPVDRRNWYFTGSPLTSTTVGAENFGVRVLMTSPS